MESIFWINVLMLLFTMSCTGPEPERPNQKVNVKFCLDACMKATFKDFHSTGESWGTGSSSMNGLTQTEIFDRVKKYCDDFYKDEECYQQSIAYLGTPRLSHIHGYDYGPKLH